MIELDGDRATVRANLVVYFAEPLADGRPSLAPAIQSTMGEIYRFDVVRTPDGWRFARIETSPVWMAGAVPSGPRTAEAG